MKVGTSVPKLTKFVLEQHYYRLHRFVYRKTKGSDQSSHLPFLVNSDNMYRTRHRHFELERSVLSHNEDSM
jgi:hypothetical protein